LSPLPAPARSVGYSGTPLPRKLGIKEGHQVALDHAPRGFESTLGELPEGVRLGPIRGGDGFDVILLFAHDLAQFSRRLPEVKARMKASTALWICWAKKTSPLASDVTEALVRERGLDAGLVDIKVCAVDEDWSGLKFVYRLKDRDRASLEAPKAKARKKK
jgi:hypothetical protein